MIGRKGYPFFFTFIEIFSSFYIKDMKYRRLFKIKRKYILWKLNYFKDQKGILNRYLAEHENWKDHLENTRRFIADTLEKLDNPAVAILGSGWLLDIPMGELVAKAKNITLIDVIHPEKIKNKYSAIDKVSFIETDLTGGLINKVYKLLRKKGFRGKLTSLIPELSVNLENYDMVFSVNILNQLDILLKDYIKKYMRYDDKELEEFSRMLQSFHLNSLPENKSALVTDYLEYRQDRDGNVVESQSLIYADIKKQKDELTWIWKFDTRMTYNPGLITAFKVKAFYL